MTLAELNRLYNDALCDETTTDEELNDLWFAIQEEKDND